MYAAAGNKAPRLPFRHIQEGADRIQLHTVKVADGGKTVHAPFVKEGHKECFHNIVFIMPKCDFIAAQLFRGGIQRALAHFSAERTWVLFLTFFEYNLPDICFDKRIRHANLLAERADIVIRRAGQTEGNGDSRKLKGLGIEPLEVAQGNEQAEAVLAAGNAYSDFIAGLYHMVIVHRAADVAP